MHFERWSTARTLTNENNSLTGRKSISFKKLSRSSVDSVDRSSIRKNCHQITNGDNKQVYFAHIVNENGKACRKNLLFNCSKGSKAKHHFKCIDEETI